MNRKYILLFFVFCGVALPLHAQPIDTLWMQAGDTYMQARYQEAYDLYKAIYNSGLESSELYYNIGNCAYKCQNYAQAILWYERAQLLDPKNADIAYNLEMANRFCLDKITPLPHFFLHSWLRTIRDTFPADGWAWGTLLLFALSCLLLLTFFFGRSRMGRRWAFYGSLFVLLLAVGAFSFGWSQKQQVSHRNHAVVFAPVVSVKSAPDRQGKDLFIIHEGTKVHILEQMGAWGRIELADGRQGWMEMEMAERI